jgi:hypothetical protein
LQSFAPAVPQCAAKALLKHTKSFHIQDRGAGAGVAVGVCGARGKRVVEAHEIIHVQARRARAVVAVGVSRWPQPPTSVIVMLS